MRHQIYWEESYDKETSQHFKSDEEMGVDGFTGRRKLGPIWHYEPFHFQSFERLWKLWERIKKYHIIKEACLKIVNCHVPNEKTLTKVHDLKEILRELAMNIWSRELQKNKCLRAIYHKLQMWKPWMSRLVQSRSFELPSTILMRYQSLLLYTPCIHFPFCSVVYSAL